MGDVTTVEDVCRKLCVNLSETDSYISIANIQPSAFQSDKVNNCQYFVLYCRISINVGCFSFLAVTLIMM